MTQAVVVEGDRRGERSTLINAAIIIIIGVLTTTLAQPQLLGRIPIQNLLKNSLHVGRSANAFFMFIIGLPWYFKPIAGVLTDAFPVLGSRRRSYILLSGALATVSWIALAFTPHAYAPMLWVCLILSVFMVIASCVIGAYMVEVAQTIGASGRLSALRNFVQQTCYLIQGPTAGYLAAAAFGVTCFACGGVMFLIVPATLLLMRETPTHVDSGAMLSNAGRQVLTAFSSKYMWAAIGLMALFYFAPGLYTATFYKQQNDLGLNTQTQGFLTLLSGVGGIGASLLYGLVCRRFRLRTLLVVCLLAGTAANMGYLFYTSLWNAEIVETFNGFGYILAELALMDLAVRATPPGCEGMSFSLMMSVRNIGILGMDPAGSALLDHHIVNFNGLVIVNGLTTLAAVPLVFLLPRLLVRAKDAEAPSEPAAPRPDVQA